MIYKKSILFVLISLTFQACATKNLSQGDLLYKAITQCKQKEVAILNIPSRGLLADTLSISTVKSSGNDEGFGQNFSQSIHNGFTNIAVYSPSSLKSEALLSHTLNSYKDGELKKISICVIGMEQNQALLNEANRTGSFITFIP